MTAPALTPKNADAVLSKSARLQLIRKLAESRIPELEPDPEAEYELERVKENYQKDFGS